ncbi:MAG: response regulator transcription factor [Solirubrobacterales bacterium]
MDKNLIYIVDDEINICNIIKSFLVKENFEVEIFHEGTSLMEAVNENEPSLIILDIMMPGIDGYSLCSQIREHYSVPIIMLSARDTEPDKIAGLTIGADDYLTKPFSLVELTARIKSLLRRIILDKNNSTDVIQSVFDVLTNSDIKQAYCNGKSVGLTLMEFSLLNYLITNKNKAISRKELLDKIWGFENDIETRATDDMIKRIRKKLAIAGSILVIETIWGYGFTIKDKDLSYEK